MSIMEGITLLTARRFEAKIDSTWTIALEIMQAEGRGEDDREGACMEQESTRSAKHDNLIEWSRKGT